MPLYQHVLVGGRLYDLFAGDAPTAGSVADGNRGRPEVNPALLQVSKSETRWVRDDSRRPRGRSGQGKRSVSYGSGSYGGAAHRSRYEGQHGRPRSLGNVSRPDMIETLDAEALLPAIVFIFSRVGCDAAVRQVLSSAIRLTSPAEQDEIMAIAERHVAGLSAADLRVLDYSHFLDALTRGVAAHHAGMLPAFKECVEETFVRGLTKVVFATETLALGINMPARSVVLEKLVKFNGDTHADITPGEFTQLTGRAGRRGIDVEGHAVVLWQPGLDPRAVAGLASRRTYPAPVLVRADVQHGGESGRPGRARNGRGPCWSSPSRSSSPTGPWWVWPVPSPGTPRRSPRTGRPRPVIEATSRPTPGCGPRSGRWSRGWPVSAASTGAPRPCRRSWPCDPATSSGCRPARTPAGPSSSTPTRGRETGTIHGRSC